ncbi:MAG: AMP-binding protein [Rickettsiales bacterium]|jgi:acyl-[acyl-carrier-protein]-phospholipid O-acyltransferase/long-chain-fatty-acid--[acyl-carrier-protein] ligase|nr:AMP-binding protein [Rickettsiales bacterium]
MFLRFKKKILRILFQFFKARRKFNFDVSKLPQKVLYISNHISFLDPILIFAFVPGIPVMALPGYLIRKKIIRWILKGVELVEFNPMDPSSIKCISDIIDSGKSCFLFPENRISNSGNLMKIYDATALIVEKTKVPVVGIWIDGAQYSYFSILDGKLPLRPLPKITVTMYGPINVEIVEELKKDKNYLSNKIYRILVDLQFKSLYDKDSSIFAMFVRLAKIHVKKRFLKRIKVVEDAKRVPQTHKDIVVKSFVLGNFFKKHFEHQENVGVLLPNSAATLCTLLGLMAYERTATIINFSTGILNVVTSCKTATVKNILTSKEFISLGKMEELEKSLKEAGFNIHYLEDIAKTFTLKDKLTALFQYKRKYIPYPKSGDRKAVILFTSGSEGTPKAVVLSHNNLAANINQCRSIIDVNNTDIIFNVLPMFHSFGLTVGTLFPLISGGRVFLYPSPLHYKIIPEIFYEIGATAMFATDTFFRGYTRSAHPSDFGTVRILLGGAEAIRQDNRETWAERFGIRLLEGYGATECSPVIAANNLIYNKYGSIGQLLPAMECKLKKVEGVNSGGVLCVRGPNIMLGYYYGSNPGVLVPVGEDGWYETGDVVDIDVAGYLYIRDRVKRFAKIAGEMVSLTAVENIAEKAFEHLKEEFQYGAVAIPHESRGEQIVLATNNKAVSQEILQKYIRNNNISELYLPRSILYKESFPVLGNGKRNNIELKKEILFELGMEENI